jgi:uncharacterized protein
MTDAQPAPTAVTDRIGQLDIIRGFALFGVLLMNLYGHNEFALPAAQLEDLATAPVDQPLGALFGWLVDGKAQALFSMLFGFGFAMFLERAEARGANGVRLYLRRLTILAVIGFAHMWLIFFGDILNAYALTGFLLILVRRWPNWALLSAGIILSLFSSVAMGGYLAWVEASTGATPPLVAAWEAGMERRFDIFLGNDAVAYVGELFRSSGDEWFLSPFAWSYFSTVLGRFLIGFWLFRQGWLRRPADHAEGFRRWGPVLLSVGLAVALADAGLGALDLDLNTAGEIAAELLHKSAQLLLATGYGAALIMLLQKEVWRRVLSGLGAVGRMALTNYLMQSLVYLFVFYGFGLGLMRYGGAVTCLLIAVPAFVLQIVFSRWWLARFRFGPAEWLWRSATYGQWQRFRAPRVPEPTASA